MFLSCVLHVFLYVQNSQAAIRGFFFCLPKKKKNTNVKKEKEVTKYLSVHEETFDGTHQLTDKTRTSIKVSPSLRSFRFRRRVPATPQTENKASSLGEHPRKFGNAFSCTGSFVNSPKISISSSPQRLQKRQGPVNSSPSTKKTGLNGDNKRDGRSPPRVMLLKTNTEKRRPRHALTEWLLTTLLFACPLQPQ